MCKRQTAIPSFASLRTAVFHCRENIKGGGHMYPQLCDILESLMISDTPNISILI